MVPWPLDPWNYSHSIGLLLSLPHCWGFGDGVWLREGKDFLRPIEDHFWGERIIL